MQPLVYRRSVGFGVPSSWPRMQVLYLRGHVGQKGRSERITPNKLLSRCVSTVFNGDTEPKPDGFYISQATPRLKQLSAL